MALPTCHSCLQIAVDARVQTVIPDSGILWFGSSAIPLSSFTVMGQHNRAVASIEAFAAVANSGKRTPSHYVCLPDSLGHEFEIASNQLKAGEGEGCSGSGPCQICQAASIEALRAIFMVDLQKITPPQQGAEPAILMTVSESDIQQKDLQEFLVGTECSTPMHMQYLTNHATHASAGS